MNDLSVESDVVEPEKPTLDSMSDTLDELAARLAKDAMKEDASFSARLDTFKALSAYHLGRMKIKARMPDDDADATDFNGIKRRIQNASRGEV